VSSDDRTPAAVPDPGRTDALAADVIWLRPDRAGRGPRPTHSRAAIVTVAVAIADADGLDAVSMRRLAAELGSGAASLYRYVARKDDLLDLMVDTVVGEGPPPAAPSGDWRADLREIAYATRAMILRHPWVATLFAGRPTLGPNRLRAGEHTLSVIDRLGLSLDEMMAVIDTLLAFIRGHVITELAEQEAARRSGLDWEAWLASRAAYVRTIIESGQYPQLARIWLEAEGPHDPHRAERSFEFGLERVLDGFVAFLPARPAGRPSRADEPERPERGPGDAPAD
jgi:AcrR family transcriptional regulator